MIGDPTCPDMAEGTRQYIKNRYREVIERISFFTLTFMCKRGVTLKAVKLTLFEMESVWRMARLNMSILGDPALAEFPKTLAEFVTLCAAGDVSVRNVRITPRKEARMWVIVKEAA